ncbi:hypothetical protein H9P43_006803 [Blastocladiella emersonii ATCC 22665]|nr:hypothetical protein H9P43_006803 [Blastocladiella emersonii ATCC 22665]
MVGTNNNAEAVAINGAVVVQYGFAHSNLSNDKNAARQAFLKDSVLWMPAFAWMASDAARALVAGGTHLRLRFCLECHGRFEAVKYVDLPLPHAVCADANDHVPAHSKGTGIIDTNTYISRQSSRVGTATATSASAPATATTPVPAPTAATPTAVASTAWFLVPARARDNDAPPAPPAPPVQDQEDPENGYRNAGVLTGVVHRLLKFDITILPDKDAEQISNTFEVSSSIFVCYDDFKHTMQEIARSMLGDRWAEVIMIQVLNDYIHNTASFKLAQLVVFRRLRFESVVLGSGVGDMVLTAEESEVSKYVSVARELLKGQPHRCIECEKNGRYCLFIGGNAEDMHVPLRYIDHLTLDWIIGKATAQGSAFPPVPFARPGAGRTSTAAVAAAAAASSSAAAAVAAAVAAAASSTRHASRPAGVSATGADAGRSELGRYPPSAPSWSTAPPTAFGRPASDGTPRSGPLPLSSAFGGANQHDAGAVHDYRPGLTPFPPAPLSRDERPAPPPYSPVPAYTFNPAEPSVPHHGHDARPPPASAPYLHHVHDVRPPPASYPHHGRNERTPFAHSTPHHGHDARPPPASYPLAHHGGHDARPPPPAYSTPHRGSDERTPFAHSTPHHGHDARPPPASYPLAHHGGGERTPFAHLTPHHGHDARPPPASYPLAHHGGGERTPFAHLTPHHGRDERTPSAARVYHGHDAPAPYPPAHHDRDERTPSAARPSVPHHGHDARPPPASAPYPHHGHDAHAPPASAPYTLHGRDARAPPASAPYPHHGHEARAPPASYPHPHHGGHDARPPPPAYPYPPTPVTSLGNQYSATLAVSSPSSAGQPGMPSPLWPGSKRSHLSLSEDLPTERMRSEAKLLRRSAASLDDEAVWFRLRSQLAEEAAASSLVEADALEFGARELEDEEVLVADYDVMMAQEHRVKYDRYMTGEMTVVDYTKWCRDNNLAFVPRRDE